MTARIRRENARDWRRENPILGVDEPGIDTNTEQTKYGDGRTRWNDLPFNTSLSKNQSNEGVLITKQAPNNSVGKVGDYYLDISSGQVYGPKNAPQNSVPRMNPASWNNGAIPADTTAFASVEYKGIQAGSTITIPSSLTSIPLSYLEVSLYMPKPPYDIVNLRSQPYSGTASPTVTVNILPYLVPATMDDTVLTLVYGMLIGPDAVGTYSQNYYTNADWPYPALPTYAQISSLPPYDIPPVLAWPTAYTLLTGS